MNFELIWAVDHHKKKKKKNLEHPKLKFEHVKNKNLTSPKFWSVEN